MSDLNCLDTRIPKFHFVTISKGYINNRAGYRRLRKVSGRLRKVSRRLAGWLAGCLAGWLAASPIQAKDACMCPPDACVLILKDVISGEIYLIELDILSRCICGIVEAYHDAWPPMSHDQLCGMFACSQQANVCSEVVSQSPPEKTKRLLQLFCQENVFNYVDL